VVEHSRGHLFPEAERGRPGIPHAHGQRTAGRLRVPTTVIVAGICRCVVPEKGNQVGFLPAASAEMHKPSRYPVFAQKTMYLGSRVRQIWAMRG
jgi:hypothetical protein